MKTPMWFVKAVGLDDNCIVKAQILLTPPMSKSAALEYHSFVVASNNASKMRYALEETLFEKFGNSDIVQCVNYILFETTLY